jgi:hypothetical protein
VGNDECGLSPHIPLRLHGGEGGGLVEIRGGVSGPSPRYDSEEPSAKPKRDDPVVKGQARENRSGLADVLLRGMRGRGPVKRELYDRDASRRNDSKDAGSSSFATRNPPPTTSEYGGTLL